MICQYSIKGLKEIKQIHSKQHDRSSHHLKQKKSTGLDQVTAKFYQLLKDKTTAMPFKLFHKIECEQY